MVTTDHFSSIPSPDNRFQITNRLLIQIIILEGILIIGILSLLSKPVVDLFGSPLLPINLNSSDRSQTGRIIILYHMLVMPFLSAMALLALDTYQFREGVRIQVRWTLFVGGLFSGLGGLFFAYLFTSWVWHTVFLLGLALMFYSGLLLIYGLMPTKNFPGTEESKGSFLGPINFEYLNFWIILILFVISGAIGGYVSSFFGNGFEAVLAEDIVRQEHFLLERMVISHLHIMLALLAAGTLMFVFRYSKMEGRLLHYSMLLVLPGTIITTIGTWLVIPGFEQAHIIINVGVFFWLFAGLILAVFGYKTMMKKYLGDEYDLAEKVKKFRALLSDPVPFGMYFMLIFANFVGTLPGVYVATHLDLYRSKAYTEVERSFNTGHWHIIGGGIMVIMFLYALHYFEIKGKIRSILGWGVIISSTLAFSSGVVYLLRPPSQNRQVFYILMDFGIGFMFIILMIFGILKLVNLLNQFKNVEDV